MSRRYYSSIAERATLSFSVDATTTTFFVNAVVGWPSNTPYTLLVDADTINEEIVTVTNRSGTTLTVIRGVDGSTAKAHDAGADVRHGVSARDFDEPNAYLFGTGSGTLTAALGSKLDLAGGKILQIVRATDSTQRSTTSATFVDASISVTITPQKNDSAILLVWSSTVSSTNVVLVAQITDNSNNALSGAQGSVSGTTTGGILQNIMTVIGYSTPGTVNATTYKGRFRSSASGTSVFFTNADQTAQLYAIEVSA